jgi:beta-glucosidase
VAAAQAADVVVMALGDTLQTCGEWADRDSLDLPGGQLALLAAVAATGKPLVVVLINGRAASFGPANALLANVSALVEAWRPGQAGARAIVDVLTGAVNPSGKLASQWAQHVGQLASGAQPWLARRVGKWIANGRSQPDPTDGREYDPYVATAYPSTPLFRFGAGLSYTTFEYRALALSPAPSIASLPGGGVFSGRGRAGYVDAINTTIVTASVTVCNTGGRAGTEVVQVYSQDPSASDFDTPLVPYWKRLVGFGRLALAPGSCDTLAVPLLADNLAQYDPSMVLRIVPGSYKITAGGRSDTDTLSAALVMA